MRYLILLFSIVSLVSARESRPLTDWNFHLGDQAAAAKPDFDATSWKAVTLPHDWSWEAGPRSGGVQQDAGGFRIGGIGWYRHEFTLPAAWKEKHVAVHFDAAYRNANVWINGNELGARPYGFISFHHDLSEHLVVGKNVLAVRCDNSLEPSSRWYHPCGLYAPVNLVATDRNSRFTHDGVFVTTPEIGANRASVHVSAEITGPENLSARIEILSPSGKILTSKDIPASATITCEFSLDRPELWSPGSPSLHTARLALMRGTDSIDSVEVPFGIRSIQWDKNTGFSLNGKVTKLKGVCEHLTGGPVGGAWPEPLIEWKLRLLKSMGCNAIRTAHNPQIPAFYDLCDRLGILVMNEIFDGWKRKAPQDYGAHHFNDWWRRDLTAWIRRDRNHPCVVILSVGNETNGPVAKDIVKLCHELDPTRLVTSGHSGSEAMDVFGVNGHSESKSFINEGPFNKPFIATEAPHTWQVRGFYKTQTWYRDGFPNKRQEPYETPNLTSQEIFTNSFLAPSEMKNRKQIFLSSYDNATVRINARQNWQIMRDTPWFSGHFRWTGFDYPGEAGYIHGGFPFHAFAGGPLDLAGFEKDLYYFYQSQWTTKPMVHLLPHWTHPRMKPGTPVPVHAYSNAEEVELLIDGKSLGIRKPGTRWDQMQCEWLVPWTPGTLTAIARKDGKEVVRTRQQTAAAPSRLSVIADKRFSQYPILTVTTTDSEGRLYPYGENRIFANVDDATSLLSFENGHPADTDRPIATNRRAFMGAARLFLSHKAKPENSTILLGAILGERRQLISNLAAIDVQRLDLDAKPIPSEFVIHYTLDGSEPGESSPRYTAPFEVPASCTVKAIALLDGKSVLSMEETFGPGLGLHWSSPGEIVTAAEGASTALQAETAKFSRAKVVNAGKGFLGTGFLDFKGAEDSVEFYQENDGPAGDATLVIRYAHADSKRQRPLDVMLNGKKLKTVKFPATSSWNSDWKTIEIPCRIQNGANSLVLRTIGQSAPNLDQVEFR